LFSPWLRITNVEIVGLQRVDRATVQAAIDAELDSNLLWVLPRRSWLLAPTSQIEAELRALPAVAQVSSERNFPGSLTVTIQERIASVSWQSGERFYEVDDSGQAIREMATTSDPLLPLVIDSTSTAISLGGTAAPSELIKLVLEAHSALAGRGVVSYGVDGSRSNVKVSLGTWSVYFGIQAKVSDQREALDALLATLNAEQRNRLDYIDVRLPDLPTYKLW
jgi:cell division septal protein FtsQ